MMGPYGFGSLDYLPVEDIEGHIAYHASRLVQEAETERGILEDRLEPESFLTSREKALISHMEMERRELLEKGLEVEASVPEYYIGEYLKRGQERKEIYIDWVINENYNPDPDIFMDMPSLEEIEEHMKEEFAYEAWVEAEGTGWVEDSAQDIYMRLFGETLH